MPRPTLDERLTIRIPAVLLAFLFTLAAKRNCSVNHIVNECFEHEFWRIGGYSLDFYNDFVPLWRAKQGDNVRQWQTEGQ
jgi:hypothetical protein